MKKEVLQFKSIFSTLYGKEDGVINKQLDRYSELASFYREKFGEKELHYFSTPGRTEIGGNHTDHNHGRVLAGSINLDSIAVASVSGTNQVTVFSVGYENSFVVDLDKLEVDEQEFGTTTSLIRGIAARLKEQGYQVG